MDEKTRRNIFDPFFTTKRDKGGTGLGLSITYGIIKEHGGNISVDTSPGVGTTFTISIPAESPGKK
jgi:signal transduction histidine kinase